MIFEHIIIAIQSDLQREGLRSIIHKQVPECSIHMVDSASGITDLCIEFPESICLFERSAIGSDIDTFLIKLHGTAPDAKTVLLVLPGDINQMRAAIGSGIHGLFTHLCSSGEIIRMLTEVSSGSNFYSTHVTNAIISTIQNQHSQQINSKTNITKRENEILTLIVNGYTSAEIAEKLFISPRTVETHRSNLMTKLKLKNTAELVKFALIGRDE